MTMERVTGVETTSTIGGGSGMSSRGAAEAPWEAEREVDAELAAKLVSAQFPALRGAPVRQLGAGWDNVAYRVGDHVFRFPRRAIAVSLLQQELKVLPWLAPELPLRVPAPKLAGAPSDLFPWPFSGYRILPGRTADEAGLAPHHRAAAAAPLGHFLRALHDVQPPRGAGIVGDRFGKLDLGARIVELQSRLEQLSLDGLVHDQARLIAAAAETPQAPSPEGPTLVHGDLYARHLLVDAAGTLTGVIDWGDVHWGDPAVDLAIAWSFLGGPARAAFRAAYGPISAQTWQRARFRALFHTVALLVYAHDVSDDVLLREGLASLDHVRQGCGGVAR